MNCVKIEKIRPESHFAVKSFTTSHQRNNRGHFEGAGKRIGRFDLPRAIVDLQTRFVYSEVVIDFWQGFGRMEYRYFRYIVLNRRVRFLRDKTS
jgi:hypothetical protein